MTDSLWTLLAVPLGFGLFGFFEPCSIGTSLLFIKMVEGKPARTKLAQAVVFTATRAVFIGLLGATAAIAGAIFFGFQRAGWVLLGAVYFGLGLLYLTGNSGRLMRSIGPNLGKLTTLKGTAALGVFFGLNIPACAAPLLAAVLGTAAIGGPSHVVQGFVTLAVFGLALSLPLAAAMLWAPARRLFDRVAALSHRIPKFIGILFVLLGGWSIYFGLFVSIQP